MKCEITHGEYFDRLTILVNKVYNCRKPEDVLKAMMDLIRLSTDFRDSGRAATISDQITALRDTNKKLWELEEYVRVEQDGIKRLAASDKIRELNGDRAGLKASIDELYGCIPEVKDYGSSSK